jgi:neutral ceramidase
MALKAGVGKVEITPPVDVYLAGGLQKRKADVVGSPLYAKALILDNGEKQIGFMSLDILVVDKQTIAVAGEIIKTKVGMNIENIMVSATHTHSAPYTTLNVFDGDEGIDKKWFAELPSKMAESVLIACNNMKEAQVGAGSGYEESISHHRRMKMADGSAWNDWLSPPRDQIAGVCGPIDPEVGVLKVEKIDGTTLGAIINFTCHNNAGDSGISADFAGYATGLLEKVENGESVALFMPGTCGNIGAGGAYGGARKMGKILGAEALKMLAKIPTDQDVKLSSVRREIKLPLRDYELQIDEIRKIWPGGEEVFRKEMDFLKQIKEKHVSTYIQVIAINNIAFVAVPGEMFVELGLIIKEKSPFEHTYVVELANDYIGYIPTRVAFKEGGYETLNARSSRVGPEAGEMVVENAISMLESLKE